jgi:hypothetical protein
MRPGRMGADGPEMTGRYSRRMPLASAICL